jgi:hypothetical protein
MVYLITFNCYGAWLPGDERGWIERGAGYRVPNKGLEKYYREAMKQEPYLLDLAKAHIVLEAIREVCRFRDWDLIAAHVRTTHVHVIVDRLQNVDRAGVDFKSYASRALGTDGRKRWARGGSTRPLSTPQAVSRAIECVVNQPGEPMALALPSVQVWQEAGQQADRGQESTDLVDEVDAAPVGYLAKESSAYASHAECEAKEEA